MSRSRTMSKHNFKKLKDGHKGSLNICLINYKLEIIFYNLKTFNCGFSKKKTRRKIF